jgi:hypothetical protein
MRTVTTVQPRQGSKLHKAALKAMARTGYSPSEYDVTAVDLFGDGTAAVHFVKWSDIFRACRRLYGGKRMGKTPCQQLVFNVTGDQLGVYREAVGAEPEDRDRAPGTALSPRR